MNQIDIKLVEFAIAFWSETIKIKWIISVFYLKQVVCVDIKNKMLLL